VAPDSVLSEISDYRLLKHKGDEVFLLTIWYQLAISGNRSAQQKISVSTKVSKGIVPFKQEFCGSSLLKKRNSTRLGQLRKSTGEFSRSAQGTPKLTIIKKLRPTVIVRLPAQFCYQTKMYSLMVLLIQR